MKDVYVDPEKFSKWVCDICSTPCVLFTDGLNPDGCPWYDEGLKTNWHEIPYGESNDKSKND